jgi:cardiolipin synthase
MGLILDQSGYPIRNIVYKGAQSLVFLINLWLLFLISMFVLIWKEYRHPAKCVAWLITMLVFPFLGFVLYFFLGQSYTNHYIKRKTSHMKPVRTHKKNEPDPTPFKQLFRNVSSYSMSDHNEVHLLTNPVQAYQAMLQAIQDAQHHIHFLFYTLRDDHIGSQFQEILIQKALQGIKVRMIVDGIGSYALSQKYIQKMKAAHIEIYAFSPLIFSFFRKKLNYRNHRKVLILDGYVGFIGGINIGDEYLGRDPELGFWRDTHLRLKGESVYQLQYLFLSDWSLSTGQLIYDPLFFPRIHQCHSATIQILDSSPEFSEDLILKAIFAGIVFARERIYISTPYFIPDISIRRGLQIAAMQGIDVKIILPDKVDSVCTKYATQSYIEELLSCGVEFYYYQKGFMHAKVMIIDHELATIGSANLDIRSFYDNFEVLAVVFDQQTVRQLEKDFIQDLQDCLKVDRDQFLQRSRWHKTKERLARLWAPFL